jgi:hypothetical protein
MPFSFIYDEKKHAKLDSHIVRHASMGVLRFWLLIVILHYEKASVWKRTTRHESEKLHG